MQQDRSTSDCNCVQTLTLVVGFHGLAAADAAMNSVAIRHCTLSFLESKTDPVPRNLLEMLTVLIFIFIIWSKERKFVGVIYPLET